MGSPGPGHDRTRHDPPHSKVSEPEPSRGSGSASLGNPFLVLLGGTPSQQGGQSQFIPRERDKQLIN